MVKKKELKNEISRLWITTKKDFNKVIKDGALLIKQGEGYIKDKSKKGKKKLEAMTLALEREKLYYELGKSLANLSRKKWANSKKAEDLLVNIKKISAKIKRA